MTTNGAVIETQPMVAAPFTVPLSSLHRAFQQAQPYRHVVIDGFLEPEIARQMASAFPP
jgi:hypothetical protein